jgi:hypothetical protein
MAGFGYRHFVGVVIAGSMLVSSTGAVAATTTLPATEINPWAALSAMSGGASAAVLCGTAAAATASAAAAAAQPATGCVLPVLDTTAAPPPQPVPVPPVEPASTGFGVSPLLIALGVLAAGALLYFVLRHHHHANSPM